MAPTKEDPTKVPPILQIYRKLDEFFGNKTDAGQLFTMEYPGRILDMGTYHYDGSDTSVAQDIKPQAVAEAEFRLADDLFTIGQISGGPNGAKLSEVYDEILGGLVPNGAGESVYEADILPDQDKVIAWLLEDVPNWIPPKHDALKTLLPPDVTKHVPVKEADKIKEKEEQEKKITGYTASAASTPEKIPRIDLYQKLLDAYEEEKFRWEQFKLSARPKNDNDTAAWDRYNRIMATYAPVVDKKLEGLWATLVARGQYHRVRHCLGLVDVTSASETLLTAKESLRASVMRSVDDTQDIYPVQFSPASWAQYLTTDYTPVDLLMNPASLRAQLVSREEERRQLISRLASLNKGQISDAERLKLQRAADQAQQNLRDSENEMLAGYAESTATIIQMYLKSRTKLLPTGKKELEDVNVHDLNKTLETGGKPGLSDEDFAAIVNGMKKCNDNHSKFMDAAEANTRALGELAGATAADATLAISQCQEQIESVSAAIQQIKDVLMSVPEGKNMTGYDPTTGAPQVDPPAQDGPPAPTKPKAGASQWQTVTATGHFSSSDKTSSLVTSADHTSWKVGCLFGSVGHDKTTASAESSESSAKLETDLSIGFQAMKVTINRPWFDETILEQTKDYYRIGTETRISTGPDSYLKSLVDTSVQPKDKEANLKKAQATILPSYPVAFIIAKDISINMSCDANTAGSTGKDITEKATTGGGFLCFSMSSSSDNHSTSHSAFNTHDDKHVNIRIPGPQIIGWIMQSTPEDKSALKYTHINASAYQVAKPPAPAPP